jgi:hypothetical protein
LFVPGLQTLQGVPSNIPNRVGKPIQFISQPEFGSKRFSAWLAQHKWTKWSRGNPQHLCKSAVPTFFISVVSI